MDGDRRSRPTAAEVQMIARMPKRNRFPFDRLPPEIRVMIYTYLLPDDGVVPEPVRPAQQAGNPSGGQTSVHTAHPSGGHASVQTAHPSGGQTSVQTASPSGGQPSVQTANPAGGQTSAQIATTITQAAATQTTGTQTTGTQDVVTQTLGVFNLDVAQMNALMNPAVHGTQASSMPPQGHMAALGLPLHLLPPAPSAAAVVATAGPTLPTAPPAAAMARINDTFRVMCSLQFDSHPLINMSTWNVPSLFLMNSEVWNETVSIFHHNRFVISLEKAPPSLHFWHNHEYEEDDSDDGENVEDEAENIISPEECSWCKTPDILRRFLGLRDSKTARNTEAWLYRPLRNNGYATIELRHLRVLVPAQPPFIYDLDYDASSHAVKIQLLAYPEQDRLPRLSHPSAMHELVLPVQVEIEKVMRRRRGAGFTRREIRAFLREAHLYTATFPEGQSLFSCGCGINY